RREPARTAIGEIHAIARRSDASGEKQRGLVLTREPVPQRRKRFPVAALQHDAVRAVVASRLTVATRDSFNRRFEREIEACRTEFVSRAVRRASLDAVVPALLR